jgi:hypothetical protein
LAWAASTQQESEVFFLGARHEGGEAREEGARRQLDVGGAVLPGLLQLEGHGAASLARQVAQAVVGEGRAQEVAEQGLASLGVVCGHGHLGVEVEVAQARLAPGGEDHLSVELVWAVLGGAARGDGLAVGLGERALLVVEVVERVASLLEELLCAGHDASEDLFHLARARCGRGEEGAF